MNSHLPTWDVVATVRERPEVVEAFVRDHQAAGCSTVHLYFDDPCDPSLPVWHGCQGVRAQAASGPRVRADGSLVPHFIRQGRNASDALEHSDASWILHLDADERLYARDGIAQILSRVPEGVVHLRILTHEAVFETMADADRPFHCRHFRRGAEGEAGKRLMSLVYPEQTQSLLRRGMSGHAVGKCMLRRGRVAAKGGVHFWRDAASGEWLEAVTVDDGSIILLHFDAISFGIWKEKLGRRVAREVRMSGRDLHRQRQLERFAGAFESGDEAALRSLFEAIYVVDASRREILRAHGCLREIDLSRT